MVQIFILSYNWSHCFWSIVKFCFKHQRERRKKAMFLHETNPREILRTRIQYFGCTIKGGLNWNLSRFGTISTIASPPHAGDHVSRWCCCISSHNTNCFRGICRLGPQFIVGVTCVSKLAHEILYSIFGILPNTKPYSSWAVENGQKAIYYCVLADQILQSNQRSFFFATWNCILMLKNMLELCSGTVYVLV